MLLSAVLAFVCFYLARQRKRAGTEQVQPKKLAKTTDKRIFNKKQLVVMWSIGILIILYLLYPRIHTLPRQLSMHIYNYNWAANRLERLAKFQPIYEHYWLFVFILPVLIIGALLVITLSKK